MRPSKNTPTYLVNSKLFVPALTSVFLCTGLACAHAETPIVPTGFAVGPVTPPATKTAPSSPPATKSPGTTSATTGSSSSSTAGQRTPSQTPKPDEPSAKPAEAPQSIDAPGDGAATKPVLLPLSPEETTPTEVPCPGNKDVFVIRFDARSGQLLLPSHRTYAGTAVQVCIQNPDYRMSYSVTTTEVPLTKTGGESLLEVLFPKGKPKGESADSGKKGQTPFQKDMARLNEQIQRCEQATTSTAQRIRGVLAYLSPSHAGAVEKLNPKAVRQKLQEKVDAALKTCEPFTSDQAQKTNEKLTQDIYALFTNDTEQKTHLASVKESFGSAQAQVDTLAKLQAIAAQLDTHLAPFDRSVIPVATRGNTEVEIVVHAKPLKATGLEPRAADDLQPSALTLSYGATAALAKTKLEVRSLSYVRVAVGLGFTSLRNDTVSEQRDAQGQAVLRTGHDEGIAGMILLSHYWHGVDEREIQPWSVPWDSGRSKTSLVNLIPSIAIGLPLTQQNTLQNFFFGLLFQPIPAVGLVFGGHVGRINQLRPEFSDGMQLPSKESGFRIDADTLEPVTKMGWFLGVMVTDSIFAKLIRDSFSK